MPRSEMLAHVLLHFDALSHVVSRVSSAVIFQTCAELSPVPGLPLTPP